MGRDFVAITVAVVISALPLCIAGAKQISGVIYHDANKNAVSYYEQNLDPVDVLLPDISVYLFSNSGELKATTSDYGTFDFCGVGAGTYFIAIGIDESFDCTSNNRASRIPDALREGHLDIVAIGDSIGVVGSDRPYPIRLAEHFSKIVDTTITNLAVGGSASWDWLPGAEKRYFEDLLVPVLPDADVITITLGGNDLVPYAPDEPPYDPLEFLKNFLENPQYLLESIPRIKTLINSIQEINPDCDIVYVIYPNIANSSAIDEYIGDLQPVASYLLKAVLSIIRGEMSKVKGIVLADMLGALGDMWLDPYLADAVHPNDAGHQLYADVIFVALGGVLVREERAEQESMGITRLFGFDACDLAPSDDDSQNDDADDNIESEEENSSKPACGFRAF